MSAKLSIDSITDKDLKIFGHIIVILQCQNEPADPAETTFHGIDRTIRERETVCQRLVIFLIFFKIPNIVLI